MKSERILLLRPDKAGDAVKTLPLLRALTQNLPDLEIHILASLHNRSLLSVEPNIVCHTELPPHTFHKAISLVCDPKEDHLELLLSARAESYFSAPMVGGSFAKRDRIRFIDFPTGTPAGTDEVRNIAHIVFSALNISYEIKECAPMLLEEDKREALVNMGEKQNRWFGLCPFAGLPHRQIPLARLESLLRYLLKKRPQDSFFLFGLPQELSKFRAPAGVHLMSPTSFRALGAYLQRCDGVIAVDSGPLHLSISLGLPVLGFLSGGDSARWFARTHSQSLLVKRGKLGKFPLSWEMKAAFCRWKSELI